MRSRVFVVSLALVVFCGAGLIARANVGDYPVDAGPSIAALARGDVRGAVNAQPLMGSVSILIRAPFAAAARELGAGQVGMYRAGVLPCIAAAAFLGMFLVRLLRKKDGAILVAVLAVLTPASLAAVRLGHPEEVLAGALAVGAVLAGARGRSLLAGVLLGLAIATKQWALIAVGPAILAPQVGRRNVAIAGAVVSTALTLPLIVGNWAQFHGTSHNAATTPRIATASTVWSLVASREEVRVASADGKETTVSVYRPPTFAVRFSHPLIIIVPLLLSVLLLRVRRARGPDAIALLALFFIVRCVFDPVDNAYYHVPLILSLLAWEVADSRLIRGVPWVTLVSAGALWVTFDYMEPRHIAHTTETVFYLAWTSALAAFLLYEALIRPHRLPVRARNVDGIATGVVASEGEQ